MFLDILLVTDAINDGSVPLRVEVSCESALARSKEGPPIKQYVAINATPALFLESQEYVPVHGDIVLKYI